MRESLLLALCAGLCLCARLALSVPEPTGQLLRDSDFGFFYFVRQWPGTFCSSHACPLLHHRNNYRFTVHGLWPNYNGGGWPQFCDHDKPFDADALNDLMPRLEEVWPSYMDSRDSDGFWAHEWNKHGTCANLPDEHAYFKAILDLNTKYDLEVPLKASGIVPSEDHAYSADEFHASIEGAYGASFDIHCTGDGKLTEVWMCFDRQLQPMDCPGSGKKAEAVTTEGSVQSLQYPKCTHILLPPVPGSPVKESDAEVVKAAEENDDGEREETEGADDEDSDAESDEDTNEEADSDSDHDRDHKDSKHEHHAPTVRDFPTLPFPHIHTCMLAMAAAVAGTTVALLAVAAKAVRAARAGVCGGGCPFMCAGRGGDSVPPIVAAADEAKLCALEQGHSLLPLSQVHGLKAPLLEK